MKILIPYIVLICCIKQAFSQQLKDVYPIDAYSIPNFEMMEKCNDEVTVRGIEVSEAFIFQLFNYNYNDLSFGFNMRIEEELPYEARTYEYSGFSYLDFSFNYVIKDMELSFTLENILNLNSKDFSIDPNFEISNGVSEMLYMSHESNSLISVSIVYNF